MKIRRLLGTILVIVLAVTFVHVHITSADTTPLATLAASMAAGSWAQLATNNINPTLFDTGADGNALGYTDDITYDPASRKFFYLGSDHDALSIFASYDSVANTWQQLPRPSWMPQPTDYNNGMMHAYNDSALDPVHGYFYHRPWNSFDVHRYNIATQTWDSPAVPTRSTTSPFGGYANCCDALQYFPELGGLVWFAGDEANPNSGHVYLLSDSTNQWTVLSSTVDLSGTWQSAKYNPVYHVVIFYSASTNKFYKLDSSRNITLIANPPFTMYDGTGLVTVLTVDPVSGQYLALSSSSRQLYAYDVPSNTWHTQASTNKPDFSGQEVVATPVSSYGVTFFTACNAGAGCQVYLYKFQASAPPPVDTTPPAVTMSAPASGSTSSGTVTVSANASDNVGVLGVQFKLDGNNLGTEDTASPYFVSWDTTTATNAAHSLTAVARDAAGNQTTSSSISVTVSNAPPVSTPPVVSMSAPAAGSTFSGTAMVSANASDNVGVVGVQFKLDGNNLGAEGKASPYSLSWDTTTATNAAHSLAAVARDAAGNQTTSSSISVTVNNATAGGAGADFVTRCAAAGVIRCFAFDNASDFNTGTGGTNGAYGQNYGILPPYGTTDYTKAVRDTTVSADGGSSLRFTIPSNSGSDMAGSWFTNFSPDLATQFGANSEFYIQYRQRFSPELLSTLYAGGGGWKQDIIGTGDQTGIVYSSCSSLETVVQNTYQRGFPQMYNSCTGSTSHGPYDAFEEAYGAFDFKLQNAMPSPYCLYSGSWSLGIAQVNPPGNCFTYFPNEWMTFQVHIKTGPRVNDEFSNSHVDLWVARDGQPSQQVFNWGPYNLSAGSAADGQQFGKIWLLPYHTSKDATQVTPTAYTWYDDLIISRNKIADPGAAPADTTPPVVSISAPASGSTGSGTVTVSANASDNVGVVGVQFKLDGNNLGAEDTVSPYSMSWDTTTATNAAHSLTAVARDAAGNQTTSSSISVTVNNVPPPPDTTPPVVSISAPASGSTASGAVTVSANASDNVGVVGVQFKLDGNNLGAEDTASPYSVSWNTTTATNAAHSLTAVARDAAGNQTTSAATSVTVNNATPPPPGSAPTLVQSVNTSSSQGNVVNLYTVRLPNATLSGNSLVAAVQQNSGSGALSVSDDKGNTYNLARTNDDGNQMVSIYYATNVIAGAQTITLTFSGSGANYVAAVVSEFYNVAAASALDGTSGNSATNSSVTAGTLTTTVDNDLIFQYAVQDGDGTNTTWTQGSSPWALLAADYFDAQAAQYQIQTAHGAINSTFTQGSSKKVNTVAIALKAAAAGTAPSGIRIVHMGHNRVPPSPPSTFTLQTPSTGNLLVVSWIGVPGCDIGSVTDGNANAYTSTGPAFGNGGSGDSQLYYAASARTSTATSGPTLTVSNCGGGSSNAMVFDISGAAASPYDAVAGRPTASGSQAASGNVTSVTITPSTANGLVITQTGVSSHTLVSITPGNFLPTENTPDILTGGVDNNNGWAINYNTNTSPESFVYGTKNGQVSAWAAIAVAFKSASSGSGGTFDYSISNSGNATVTAGSSVANTVAATLSSGTTQAISFSASGLPAGATATFSPGPCSPNCSSTTTIGTSAATPTGNYTITVTGTGGVTHTTSFSLTVNALVDTTPPSTPTGLIAVPSTSQMNLSWTASTDNVGVTGYKIFSGGTQVGTSSTNSYFLTGLTAGTSYSYAVSAYDSAGNNSAQSAIIATTWPATVKLMDLNGDGKADVVWRNNVTGEVYVWLLNGLLSPATGSLASSVPLAWQIAGIGDVNGDGKADLVWRNSVTGEVYVWLLNGLLPPTTGSLASSVPLVWQIAGIGDVNGDGKADLVWRNSVTGEVYVWLLNGLLPPTTGSLASSVPLVWQIAGIGDVNGDGRADLVWRNSITGEVDLWLLNGLLSPATGSLASSVPLVWQIAGLGDVNGDGRADLVWRNSVSGEVDLWLLNGLLPPTTGSLAGSVPLVWQITGIGDVNGDGKADLVWQNNVTGEVDVWLLNGLLSPTAGSLASTVPMVWKIEQ